MCHFNNKLAGITNDQAASFLQTYIMTLEFPISFVQTPITQDGYKFMMKISGPKVNTLCKNRPGVYDDFVIHEGKQKQKISKPSSE